MAERTYLQIILSDKGLINRIYKELLELSNNNRTISFNKMSEVHYSGGRDQEDGGLRLAQAKR
jgi:hypothetical protein